MLVGLALGTSVACVPKVPATIVVDDSRAGDHQRRSSEPTRTDPSVGDRTPPKVVRAELAGSTRVRIQFSEAIVAADDFDPADFRISYLRVYFDRPGANYYAYYYDPAYFHSGSYGNPIVHGSARLSETEIEIDFSPEFSPALCREQEYADHYDPPGIETDEGLFLHYAAGRIPLHDTAGNALADFGADWIIAGRRQPPETRMVVRGRAATQVGTSLVRVACGPPIPPGPR